MCIRFSRWRVAKTHVGDDNGDDLNTNIGCTAVLWKLEWSKCLISRWYQRCPVFCHTNQNKLEPLQFNLIIYYWWNDNTSECQRGLASQTAGVRQKHPDSERQNMCKREGKQLQFQTHRGDSDRERETLARTQPWTPDSQPKAFKGHLTTPQPTNSVFTTLNEMLHFLGGLERKKDR